MRAPRPILVATAALLLAPQAAQAASLAPLGACYRSVSDTMRESVPVRGTGFTPGERVNVYVDGALAKENVAVLPEGNVEGEVQAPHQERGERGFSLTVTEVDQPANTATVTSRVTALGFRLKPKRAKPSRHVSFIGRGFIDGTAVYAHYVRKSRHRKTVRLGVPQGPCGTFSVKRRQFPFKEPALGRWTLQVDNQPSYSAEPPSVVARWFITVTRGPLLPRG